MDLSWLVRARWRLVGAWMWPAFVLLAIADGFIGHALPLGGDTQSFVGSLLLGLICNLLVVVALAWPAAWLLRRVRRDLPTEIARDYAASFGILIISAGLLSIGLVHHATIRRDREAMRDAEVRAAAYIGAHAPTSFRADADVLSTFVIQDGVLYRACVTDPAGNRSYCVVVDERKPPARSVTPAGSEPNRDFTDGGYS